MSRKRCGRPTLGQSSYNGCQYERAPGLQQCRWHWLLKQPANIQAQYAEQRAQVASTKHAPWARVPKEQWPEGERWCSGCQSFVPLFYVSGSRCKSCNSEAAHAARVEKVYDITKEEYDALFKLQGGRCYICQRVARSKRLAVDHDHRTNEVRGLLCSDSERGCNHAILGNITGVAMAKRIVEYLEDPPYRRLGRTHTVDCAVNNLESCDCAYSGPISVPQRDGPGALIAAWHEEDAALVARGGQSLSEPLPQPPPF